MTPELKFGRDRTGVTELSCSLLSFAAPYCVVRWWPLPPPVMKQDERFERVRALLRQLQSLAPRPPEGAVGGNGTLDHALELIRLYEREWLVRNPVDVRISYWRRRARGEEMIAAMESAARQCEDEAE